VTTQDYEGSSYRHGRNIGDGRISKVGCVAVRKQGLTMAATTERAILAGGLLATLGPTAIWSEPIMANIEQHRAVLQELNRNFVRSVDEANVAWFDANLAADFLNTTPDGSLIDRKAFLAQIGRGSTDKNIREHDVMIRILGDFAIIHARTTYMNPDGTQGSGRYTDDYQFRDGRWQCVSAHYTRA
jgi:hypothetical protein